MWITCKMVFTAVWKSEPIGYTISYSNFDGSKFEVSSEIRESYTVEDETFTLGRPTRGGYEFKLWLTDEQVEQVINGELDIDTMEFVDITINKGTIGNLHYTAVWQGKPVTFTLMDVKGLRDPIDMPFIVGSTFANLPIYPNEIRKTGVGETEVTQYTFAGWSFNSDYSDRIEDTDRVPFHEDTRLNVIYVIWVEDSLYIINIQNDGSYGGTVSAAVFVEANNPIVLTINAYSGFEATGIIINGERISEPEFNYDKSPYIYSYPTNTQPGIKYYSILVEFKKLTGKPIDYPVWHNFTYDGTPHTSVEGGIGYSIEGDFTKTDAGTYTVTINLDNGYIWKENNSKDPYIFHWTIGKRTAFIIAKSQVEKYSEVSEEGWAVSETGYITMFVLERDLVALDISTYVGSVDHPVSRITEAGSYENKIDWKPSTNYNITIIHGTYIVYNDAESSTVVYAMTDRSTDTTNNNTGDSGATTVTGSEALSAIRLSSNTQSVVRRGKE